MEAISLIQPWASALFIIRQENGRALKGIETRSWKLSDKITLPLRVAVHASKGFPGWAKDFAQSEFCRKTGIPPIKELPLGSLIGCITIMGFRRTEDLEPQIDEIEQNYGDYSPGRWGWMLCDPILLGKPIPCRGALGLWEVPKGLIDERKLSIPKT
jgi:activating signal cointegrator 1